MFLRNNCRRKTQVEASATWQQTCFVVAGLLLLTAAAPTPAGKPASEQVLAERRKQIEQLSDAKRKELIRKYDAYRQLSEGERDHLRSLHHDVETNADLKNVMVQYCTWLKNLDVTQQEQLRQAKTPEQKRNLVVKIKQDQHQRREELWHEGRPPPGPGRAPIAPPSGDDLKSVMTAWEEALTKSGVITPELHSKLESQQGAQRYKTLMRTLADYRHPKGGPERPFEIPDAVLDAMASVVKSPADQQKLQRRDPNRRQQLEKEVAGALLWGTASEARLEFHGSSADSLKETIFQKMPPEFQTRYSQWSSFQQELALMGIYRHEIREAFADACDLKMPDGRGFGGRGGPFGGFPPERMRDGDRRGDGDRGRGGGFNRPRRPEDRPGQPPPLDGRPPQANDGPM